ncbi:hypothetical protein [Paraburkholderia fungorum]|uniref:hypothetical protein n=1 Tax=Paraburkholderia fungorum TaxID=134537 RepID=UPI001C1F1678|nr:hypothetical protein [Paraburkholderia fungorum]MBU7439675.1 hypothetical protein [Paraburkholderia fungorum]
MQLPDAAVGSIIAAAIAGIVVFVSTVLTKEQKTSEFRQTWIDELRKDVSEFISGTTEVTALMREKAGDKNAQLEFASENFELIQQLQSVEHRIVLRLNPIEHERLLRLVTNFRADMKSAYAGGNRLKDEENLTKELLDSTKAVLRSEWKRVKRGEPTFRCVKWIAVGLAAIMSVWLLHAYLTDKPSSDKENAADSSTKNPPTQVFVDNHAQISSCVTQENPDTSHPSNKFRRSKHSALSSQSCVPMK